MISVDAKTNFLGNAKISSADFCWRFGQKISASGRDTMLFDLKASLENCFCIFSYKRKQIKRGEI